VGSVVVNNIVVKWIIPLCSVRACESSEAECRSRCARICVDGTVSGEEPEDGASEEGGEWQVQTQGGGAAPHLVDDHEEGEEGGGDTVIGRCELAAGGVGGRGLHILHAPLTGEGVLYAGFVFTAASGFVGGAFAIVACCWYYDQKHQERARHA
jgi:hypothetical protein